MKKLELSGKTKKWLAGIVLLLLVLMLYGSGLGVQSLVYVFGKVKEASPFAVSFNPVICFYAGITTSIGQIFFFALVFLGICICLFSRWRNNILNLVSYIDERGVGFAKRGTYGTAEWLLEKEAKESKDFEISAITDAKGFILAQLDTKGQKTVALSRYRKGNFNICVIGSPGTGKSAGYVRANILQAVKMGESMVVTDPKGELYRDLYLYLESQGITVKLFNLDEPEHSDSWDCLGEIIDPVTEQADPDRAADFATIVIENTGGASRDPIWSDGAKNLLKALVLWAAWQTETYTINAYNAMLDEMLLMGQLTPSPDWTEWIKKGLSPRSDTTLRRKRELIEKAFSKSGCTEEERAALWGKYSKNIPECSLSTVYHALATHGGEEVRELFVAMPDDHAGKIAFRFFESGQDKMKSSFTMGLGIRLQLFQSRSIRRITRNKDIDLSLPGEKQCVYFVVIPDQSNATRTISSLFFNFLFKDLADAVTRQGPDKRIPVNIMADEFCNIGMIPEFDNKIAISRSRKINISILIQNPSQLWELYGENDAATIISCCDATLFLGSSDPDTCKYIARRTGEATITVNTIKNSRGIGHVESLRKEYQESMGEGKRFVMTEHEVSNLPYVKCLVFVKGYNVMKANKFWWSQHPASNGGELPQQLPNKHQLASEHYRDTEEQDAFRIGTTRFVEFDERDDAQENALFFSQYPEDIANTGLVATPPSDREKEVCPAKQNSIVMEEEMRHADQKPLGITIAPAKSAPKGFETPIKREHATHIPPPVQAALGGAGAHSPHPVSKINLGGIGKPQPANSKTNKPTTSAKKEPTASTNPPTKPKAESHTPKPTTKQTELERLGDELGGNF